MLSMKILIVLCLGVLAAQAKPQLKADGILKDALDDVVRDLREIRDDVADEHERALDTLDEAAANLDVIRAEVLDRLEEDLKQGQSRFLLEISRLQEKAYELDIDIQDCIGNSLDTITNLYYQVLGEAAECLTLGYQQIDDVVTETLKKFDQANAEIEEFLRQVDHCRGESASEQQICTAQLQREVRDAKTQILFDISIAIRDALEQMERSKNDMRQCGFGKAEYFEQEGGQIVSRVIDCAEQKFPPTQ